MNKLLNEIISFGDKNGLASIMDAIPNPDMIMRKTGTTYKGYRELLYDAHLWSCVQSRKSGSLSNEYEIVGDSAELVQELLAGIDIHKLAEDILDSLFFGFQPIEIYWEMKAGKLAPQKLIAKPQELFYIDSDNQLKYRPAGQIKGIELPKRKFLDIRNKASHSNPYGMALLSKCYWPIKFKNGGIRFWVNFMERYGMPLLVGKYTRGSTMSEAEKLAELLAGMTEDSVIVTPNDIDISLEEPHRYSSVRLYSEMIKLSNSEISKAVLSQTLTTEISTGSRAAAETHFKIRNELVRSDMRLVENGINTLIRYALELNNGRDDNTRFQFKAEKESLDKKLERDLRLHKSGAIKLNKEYFTTQYGYKMTDLVLNSVEN